MASTLEGEAKKFLEGWTSYKPDSAKVWKKCWMVLRGSFVFLFSSERPTKEHMVDSPLGIGFGTIVSDIKSKKEFKFQLSTMSQKGQMEKNIFKFNKESDCRLWKTYIVAIATGSIPIDARLLPGQRSDVYEAMIEVQKQNGFISPFKSQPTGSPNGRLGLHSVPERLDIDEDIETDDPAIRQLNKRLEELAKKEINDSELTPSVSSWPINEILDTIRPKGSDSLSARSVASTDATVAITRSHSASPATSVGQKSTNLSKRTSFSFSNHAFYTNGPRNSNGTPSWFVNCSRDQSEAILTTGSRYGSVLMRASSGFPINGNYVISFRRERQGKVIVSHYNIIRIEEGFKLDVENKHSPMPTLSVVMEFFLAVAGKTAKPLTSNDLTQLLGKYQAAAFPTVTEEETVQMRSDGLSIHSHGLPSFGSQPNMSGSDRSSSIGSQSSRNSRGSFDFPSRRTSEPHNQHLPSCYDDRRPSAAPSVFSEGHALAKASSEVSGSPPSYGGSFAGSMCGDGAPRSSANDLHSVSRRFLNEDAVSSPNDSQVYSNHSETITPEDRTSGEEHRISGSGSNGCPGSVSHYGSGMHDTSRNEIKSARGNTVCDDSSGYSGVSKVRQLGPLSNASIASGARSYLQGTLASDPYVRQNSSKQLPPLPPPKPGAREIYMLMKPLPSVEGDYSSGSVIGGLPEVDGEESGKPSTSVKELARMLQCTMEK